MVEGRAPWPSIVRTFSVRERNGGPSCDRVSRTRTPASCARLATRNIARGIHAEGTAIHGRNNGLGSTRSTMKKTFISDRRSVARPFVPRKKQLGVLLSFLFLWLSGADNRRCTVAGPMRRMDCVGWDGWVDGWMQSPRRRTRHLPPLSLCLPPAVPPILSGDIIKR